nr:MAG TPA: hypothetical protein [Bacteriophage sp.]
MRFPNFFFHSTLGSLICQPQMLRNHNFFKGDFLCTKDIVN